MDVPTLILHGDDDQIVPIADSALLSAKLVKGAILKVYKGAPHGCARTHKDQVNEDLLTSSRAKGRASRLNPFGRKSTVSFVDESLVNELKAIATGRSGTVRVTHPPRIRRWCRCRQPIPTYRPTLSFDRTRRSSFDKP